jgi:hypothetical protein
LHYPAQYIPANILSELVFDWPFLAFIASQPSLSNREFSPFGYLLPAANTEPKATSPIMAPAITLKQYNALPLYDPKLSEVHVRDLVQMEELYTGRISSQVLGMLLMGVHVGVIQKTQCCYFRAAMLPHVRIRKLYHPDGRPFLGPDGRYLFVQGFDLGGDRKYNAVHSHYALETVKEAPNYEDWLSKLLFCGGGPDDAEYLKKGQVAPKHQIDGSRILAPAAADDEDCDGDSGAESEASVTTYTTESSDDTMEGVVEEVSGCRSTPRKPPCKPLRNPRALQFYPAGGSLSPSRDTSEGDSDSSGSVSRCDTLDTNSVNAIGELKGMFCAPPGTPSDSTPEFLNWTGLKVLADNTPSFTKRLSNQFRGRGVPIAVRAVSGGGFELVSYQRVESREEIEVRFGITARKNPILEEENGEKRAE